MTESSGDDEPWRRPQVQEHYPPPRQMRMQMQPPQPEEEEEELPHPPSPLRPLFVSEGVGGDGGGVGGGGSLFSPHFERRGEESRHNFRKHLLKMYLSRLTNENDEMVGLMKSIIDIRRVDAMNPKDIHEAVKTITLAQNILQEGSNFEQMFHSASVVIHKLRTVLGHRYPRYRDVIDTVALHFVSTFDRLEKVKNRHVEKLVMISSVCVDRFTRAQIPRLGTVLKKSVFTAMGYALIFGLLEWLNDHGPPPVEDAEFFGPSAIKPKGVQEEEEEEEEEEVAAAEDEAEEGEEEEEEEAMIL